jgi:hypothetical protein
MNETAKETWLCFQASSAAVSFAAAELQKYLQRMDTSAQFPVEQGVPTRAKAIHLGLCQELGIPVPETVNPALDDYLYVEIQSGQGIIAGSNPRSVLMAVYRFLEKAGCRFIRPGKDGEYIPAVDVSSLGVSIASKPSYRHRGVCIEGAVSLQHMLDNVDWAPKVGMNSYFLEFMVPFTFFDRWYSHELNPMLPPEPLSVDQVIGFMQTIEQEIEKRGLAYHNPGHGWTCESLGIPGLGWFATAPEISPQTRELLAEVKGRRGLYEGVALNTHLCYSNPAARKAVADYAVQYMRSKPNISYLHVWLADNDNNFCECAACRDTLPSDHYLMLLNEMDEALTAAGIPVKIVFIAYLELLWPPREQVFKNPDRFVLLFAPISRTYSRSYETDLAGIQVPEYKRNQIVLPSGIRQNLAYLRGWQEVFSGDSFTYEYYFMWDCYLDPGYYETAKILQADVQKLKLIGLNGIISDQSQRSFFPTAFGMQVMARMLWDDSQHFDDLAEEYFAADFSEDGPAVRAYMQTLSELFDPPYIRGDREPRDETQHTWVLSAGSGTPDEEASRKLGRIAPVVEAFRPLIEKNLNHPVSCRALSWRYLSLHADLVILLAQAFQARAEGRRTDARRCWEETQAFVRQHELDLHNVLDVFEFLSVLGSRFPEERP